MILVIGSFYDKTISYFQEFLYSIGADYRYIEIAELGKSVSINAKGILIKNEYFVYEMFQGVYNRLIINLEQNIISEEFRKNYELLIFILDCVLPRVINKPMSSGSNFSKTHQLSLCPLRFLKVPETIVLANHDSFELKNHDYIYKSVSSNRSIVKVIEDRDFVRPISNPVQFQKKINGCNIRVHIINDQIHAMKITSDTVDYRYHKSNFSILDECNLPDQIKAECINITKNLGLAFSGIDLIESEGDYYILEVNTCPGYDSFEEYSKTQSVSRSLFNYLKGKTQ